MDEEDSKYTEEIDSEYSGGNDAEYSEAAEEAATEDAAVDSEESEDGGEEKKKYAPILPFDISYGEQFALYENMKYVCDTDICNKSMIKMESGNVCKYYRCKEIKPAKIGGD